MEASAEVRRQRRRTATRDRRTEESRHEVRREAEAVTVPEVKNRFLSEAVTEASSIRTSASRTADTVTFVEVEAEASERRGGKGDSAWKFDKSKWISLDNARCHIFVSKFCPGRVNIYRRELVPNLFLSKVDIYVQISFCGQLLGRKFKSLIWPSSARRPPSVGLPLAINSCPGWIEFPLLIVRMIQDATPPTVRVTTDPSPRGPLVTTRNITRIITRTRSLRGRKTRLTRPR